MCFLFVFFFQVVTESPRLNPAVFARMYGVTYDWKSYLNSQFANDSVYATEYKQFTDAIQSLADKVGLPVEELGIMMPHPKHFRKFYSSLFQVDCFVLRASEIFFICFNVFVILF